MSENDEYCDSVSEDKSLSELEAETVFISDISSSVWKKSDIYSEFEELDPASDNSDKHPLLLLNSKSLSVSLTTLSMFLHQKPEKKFLH